MESLPVPPRGHLDVVEDVGASWDDFYGELLFMALSSFSRVLERISLNYAEPSCAFLLLFAPQQRSRPYS